MTKAYARWQAPEQIKSTLAGVDSVTNAFKALAYPIWIPSHVRNAFTAATNNLRHGVGLGDYLDQLKVMTGRRGRDLSGLYPTLAPSRWMSFAKLHYARPRWRAGCTSSRGRRLPSGDGERTRQPAHPGRSAA